MKREGHLYEEMAEWENIVEAERVSTKRKAKKFGVRKHKKTRWSNLCEIQQMVVNHKMKTDRYRTSQVVSGQDKMRSIAKLHFHPSHIQHQLLVLTGERRIEKALIRHTYASRKGYGQVKAALRIRDYLRKHRNEDLWYGQGDIIKYYENIPHALLREKMNELFKDKDFVEAYIEPFVVFAPEGKGIPLGIRPSQSSGNIALMGLDRLAVEELRCSGYTRYLDDFLFFGKTKGEVKRKMKRMQAYLRSLGFELHPPKIHRVSTGLDMLGYVFYNNRNDMYWRRSDKRRWLKRRSKVSNPKRLREIDASAWGMLKWGNKHCKRLYQLETGQTITKKMAVKLRHSGIKRTERTDKNGVPFLNEPPIGMTVLTTSGQQVIIDRWVKGVHTHHGDDRYIVRVLFGGVHYKLFVNSYDIKEFLDEMERNHVTLLKTVFTDKGGKHFAIDEEQTEILEVDGRKIDERDGVTIFEDSGEVVRFV